MAMLTPNQARSLVENLLRDDLRSMNTAVALPPEPSPAEALPARIGPCRITRLIAVGGMGTVYEAMQDQPHRTVAVKVLRHGLVTRQMLRRFHYEAEVLGRLQHPGIALIYDAGTYDDGGGGMPYFVMEYVPAARSITEFAAVARLDLRQRLELFVAVCDAVHYGHQCGIIHRDLKPANILVAEHGQPKIIDFGIARATDADIALTTMHTDVGELIGTLAYMSPEQCDGRPDAIDTRSDVYSLGVVLYELLCGRLPYRVGGASITRTARVIHEQEPVRPTFAARPLKRDLEAIVLKALAKPREQRYQSVADFAVDVRRFLGGEAVEARVPTLWTRSMRWVARHPRTATAAACVAVTLTTLGATTLSVWFLRVRPYEVQLAPDKQEARLITVTGDLLARWRIEEPGWFTLAKLVERPAQFGGGELVLLASSDDPAVDGVGFVQAFDALGSYTMPLWSWTLGPDNLSLSLAKLVDEKRFAARSAELWDIFPEEQSPGSEIVVAMQHGRGLCGISILDLQGKVLSQYWHDGHIVDTLWLPELGLLVLAGLNTEVYWNQRGHPEVGEAHPHVLFAVRPRFGKLQSEFLTTAENQPGPKPEWYRCILPPKSSDVIGDFALATPFGAPAGTFRLSIELRGAKAVTSWLIDAQGNEVPGQRAFTDSYRRIANPPDMTAFHLGPLPPIESPTE